MDDDLAAHRHAAQECGDQSAQRIESSSSSSLGTRSMPVRSLNSSRSMRASASKLPSARATSRAVSSTSCSSSMSPTISSTRSSIETSPSVPPYSSTTSAKWMRLDCILSRRSSAGHRRRHEQNLALELRNGRVGPGKRAVVADLNQREHVFHVDHAQGIVERFAIDRQARMLGLAEDAHEFGIAARFPRPR